MKVDWGESWLRWKLIEMKVDWDESWLRWKSIEMKVDLDESVDVDILKKDVDILVLVT